jgi:hypothetical protein
VWEFHERLAQKASITPEMPPATTGTSGTYPATRCRGSPYLPAADPAFDLFEDRALDARVLE